MIRKKTQKRHEKKRLLKKRRGGGTREGKGIWSGEKSLKTTTSTKEKRGTKLKKFCGDPGRGGEEEPKKNFGGDLRR